MFIYKTILPLAIASLAALTFTSCSDDDDDAAVINGPEDVFTAGVPQTIGSNTITTDAEGRVVKIESTDGETFKFSYEPVSRATQFDAKMEAYSNNKLDYTFYIRLNDKGVTEYVLQEYEPDPMYPEDENEPDEWWFSYDSQCRLVSFTRSENDNEVVRFAYKDGNIVTTTTYDSPTDKTPSDVTTIAYTNSAATSPIANKGCLMLFDALFNADMDEGEYLYFAGLLGKATKNLPVGYSEEDTDWDGTPVTYTYNYEWVLNASGLPTECWELSNDGTRKELYRTFTW